MKPSSTFPIILAGLLTAAGTFSSQAAKIISIDYTPEANVMPVEEPAGAPGVRVGNWNGAFTGGANTTLDLPDGSILDSSGEIVPGLSISLFTGNASGTSLRGNPPGGVAPALQNDGRMLRSVTDKFEPAEGSIIIDGIPYAQYSLYFYVYPDSGGGGDRGGYFTITNSAGVVQSRWLKGGTGANLTIALPDSATGDGYVQSTTSSQPKTFADIQAGHFVVISGLTDRRVEVYYAAVGAGAGGVTGGDGARRLKFSGFQIVEASTAALTGLTIASQLPPLYTGNPAGVTASILGQYSDGSTAPITGLSQVAFRSSNTNIFIVNPDGLVLPKDPGTAQLLASYRNYSLTQEVSVVSPVAVRPIMRIEPIYLGAIGLPATLLADFPDGKTDVDVTLFRGVSFSGGAPGVATVSSNGLVSAIGVGTFSLSASLAGITGQTENAGTVLPYTAPQPDGGRVAVSFNIQSGRAMGFTELSGAPGQRVGFWNNIVGLTGARNTVTLGPKSIADSAGKLLPAMSVSITGGSSTAAGIATRGTQSTNESTMFYAIYDQFNGTPGTLQISGIPFSTYDAYFYVVSGDADNRPGHFTIGPETRWILNSTAIGIPDNEGSGYVEAMTTTAPASVSEVQPGNYVKFSNLKQSSLNVEFVADGAAAIPDADNAAPRLKFSGFQLVGVAAPSLTASWVDSSRVRIAWPASAAGYVLKSSSTLGGPWNTVGISPTTDGDKLTITIPTSGASTFFILQSP